ncbi:MAG TPA: twin-arginine translocase subunit TatC [Candidatus Omnitrophota bacterium]|nr:twin-arginine translocase subunit TatC [Candidatus Omnitrophota bacterium]
MKSQSPLDEPIPLMVHLIELRKRLIYAAVAVVAGSVATYPLVDPFLRDLARPMPFGQFIFISPLEAFWSRIQLTLCLGAGVSLPFVLFQIWSFVQRGLLPRERNILFAVTFISFLLFVAGAAFCYYLVLPVGVKFLLAYGNEVMVPMISISRYLAFVFGLLFAFGVVFELPLVMGFLVKAGLLQVKTMRRQRRVAVVLIFIAAAALTPGPDVFSQILMAVPLLILYEFGIITGDIIERRKLNG